MDVNFNFINIIILFGAVQGFTLCLYLYRKQKPLLNKTKYFVLFLFSLSFLNLFYALLDSNFLEIYKPLYLFPFPYKYLIGVGLFFYIKYSFDFKVKPLFKDRFLLFLPAIVYGLLHIYWFTISVIENSYLITSVIIESNFFRINEFFYLTYTIVLISIGIKLLRRQRANNFVKHQAQKKIKWLLFFALSFLLKTIIDFLLYAIDLIIHDGKETLLFYYPNFILNSLFIYYVGFIGFVKPKLILNSISIDIKNVRLPNDLEEKLKKLMIEDEVFRNKRISIADIAIHLNIKDKELSNHINGFHSMNFSEYINQFRVKKVKELISSQNKYTLTALAENAGFSSKSSFYTIFKKSEGITPNEYRKSIQ